LLKRNATLREKNRNLRSYYERPRLPLRTVFSFFKENKERILSCVFANVEKGNDLGQL